MQQVFGPSMGVDEKYLLYQLTKDGAAIKTSGFAAAPECADGLKLQQLGHLIRTVNSLEKTLMLVKTDGKRRRGQQRIRWLNNITNSMDMNLSNLRKVVRRRQWHPTPVLLPGKSRGQRSLVGCIPWGR